MLARGEATNYGVALDVTKTRVLLRRLGAVLDSPKQPKQLNGDHTTQLSKQGSRRLEQAYLV